MVRLSDRPDMTLDVYRGRKTTIQLTDMDSCAFPLDDLNRCSESHLTIMYVR